MGTGPRRPILLFGFDWDTQMKQDFAATIWGVVFLRKSYTDETEESYRHASPGKQQEVKYGNNVTALFMALLHFAAYRQRPGFWEAMAQGFSFNREIIRNTVEIFTEARRIGRRRPGKHRSQLLQMADEWIEIMDGRLEPQRPHATLSNEELKPAAREYYKAIEARPLLNEARIPYDVAASQSVGALSSSSLYPPSSRRASGMGQGEIGASNDRDTPSMGSVQGIDPSRISRQDGSPTAGGSLASRITRKRSLSPTHAAAADQDYKRHQPEAPSQLPNARDIIKAAPPSPPANQSSLVMQQTEAPGPSPEEPLSTNNSDQGRAEAKLTSYQVTPLLQSIRLPQTAPNELVVETDNLPRDLISKMEDQAAGTGQSTGVTSTDHQSNDNDMETVKDDVNILLQTMQTFTETHTSLIDAVSEIREKIIKPESLSKESASPKAASLGIDGLLAQQKTYFEGLLREQNEQFKSVTRDLISNVENTMLGSIEDAVQHSINRNLEQPFADLKAHVTAQVTSALERPEPRTWGLELAALEDDVKRHLYRIDRFYHKKMDAQTVSSGLANYMADLMIALQDVIARAQTGQNASS